MDNENAQEQASKHMVQDKKSPTHQRSLDNGDKAKTLIETDNGTEVTEEFQVNPDFNHFSTDIIAGLQNNFPLTTARFEKQNMKQLMCILKGPTRNVEEARKMVESIKVTCNEVHFSTTIVHVLKTFSAETLINEFLRKEYKFCKSVQVGHEIKVYGFQIQDNTLNKAVLFVSKLIAEKDIVLTGDYLRSHANDVVRYLKNTYKNSIFVTLDQQYHLHLVGLNCALPEIEDFIVKVKTGTVTIEFVDADPQPLEQHKNRKECASASKWPGRAIRETFKDDRKTTQTVNENERSPVTLTDDKDSFYGRINTTQDPALIAVDMSQKLIVSLPPLKDTKLQVPESERIDRDQGTERENETKENTSHLAYENKTVTVATGKVISLPPEKDTTVQVPEIENVDRDRGMKRENEMKENTSHQTYENGTVATGKVEVKHEEATPPLMICQNDPLMTRPIKNLSIQKQYEETYTISGKYQQNFIDTDDCLTKMSAQFMIDVDFDKYRRLIKLRGPEENVRKARGHLENLLKALVCKHMNISKGQNVKYFMSNEGRKYLRNTGEIYDVSIEKNTTIAWNFDKRPCL